MQSINANVGVAEGAEHSLRGETGTAFKRDPEHVLDAPDHTPSLSDSQLQLITRFVRETVDFRLRSVMQTREDELRGAGAMNGTGLLEHEVILKGLTGRLTDRALENKALDLNTERADQLARIIVDCLCRGERRRVMHLLEIDQSAVR